MTADDEIAACCSRRGFDSDSLRGMDVFAPHNLPGVGMGDLASITGMLGLIGLAVTSGMLVAEGLIGTLVFVASASVLLTQKPEWGGAAAYTITAFVLLVIVSLIRMFVVRRVHPEQVQAKGRAADDPTLVVERSSAERAEQRSQLLAITGVAISGMVAGFGWSEWNEVPFSFIDREAIIGVIVGLIAAAIGGHAVNLFVRGSIRAGGSAIVVGVVVIVAVYVLNIIAVYVPFAGVLPLLLAIAVAVRLGRRNKARYKGLRILS